MNIQTLLSTHVGFAMTIAFVTGIVLTNWLAYIIISTREHRRKSYWSKLCASIRNKPEWQMPKTEEEIMSLISRGASNEQIHTAFSYAFYYAEQKIYLKQREEALKIDETADK